MPSLPAWPEAPGPRILTLVGNDLTIDVRARKTASSLARAGFSVISIGVDNAGTAPADEILDGALLHRVVPMLDPRISTRLVRLSTPEVRDWLRYRTEMQRQRLQMTRRDLTAWRRFHNDGTRWYSVRRRMKTARVITGQVRYLTLDRLYKYWARPPARAWRRGSWRRDLPELHRYEAAVAPLVDWLRPDLIHVHDVFHLGLAVRAANRAEERGDGVRVVYDAHEYIAGLPTDPVRRRGYTDLEEEYIGGVDAVVTVSDGLGALLNDRYRVTADIVLNAPDTETTETVKPVRRVIGLDNGEPLLLYVGGIAPHRGVEELLEALGLLGDDIHLALVAASTGGYVEQLMATARDRGLGDRVHLVPYVAPEAVVPYLRGATVSVIPLARGIGNYEIALPNKLFQSIHAGVPVAVSDSPEMARFVTEHGVGEVFITRQPETIAEAVRLIIDNLDKYLRALEDRALLERLSWRAQAEKLQAVYRRLGVSV